MTKNEAIKINNWIADAVQTARELEADGRATASVTSVMTAEYQRGYADALEEIRREFILGVGGALIIAENPTGDEAVAFATEDQAMVAVLTEPLPPGNRQLPRAKERWQVEHEERVNGPWTSWTGNTDGDTTGIDAARESAHMG